MAVRFATVADIPRVVDQVVALRASVRGPIVPDHERIRESLLLLLAQTHAVVFVTDGGFIAGHIAASMISPEPIAFEGGWFATDGTGMRLLNAFEDWAAQHGARVRLSTSEMDHVPASLKRALARRGYRPFETAWMN